MLQLNVWLDTEASRLENRDMMQVDMKWPRRPARSIPCARMSVQMFDEFCASALIAKARRSSPASCFRAILAAFMYAALA